MKPGLPHTGQEEIFSSHLFETLAASPMVLDYADAFRQATGLALKLLAGDSPPAPVPFGCHHDAFCKLLSLMPRGCSRCHLEHARIRQQAASTLEHQQGCCPAGMAYVAVPVVVHSEHVATLAAGQVFLQKPTPQHFEHIVRQLPEWKVGTNLACLREAYLHSRVITASEFEGMTRLLRIFAGHLAHYAATCLLQPCTTDPPGVALGKDFARQHAAESISMPDAARHGHLSACYFCKIFKKSTGLTFTEYVSRLRVENAKRCLADIHQRVSEIALACGFDSIPHFNRVFKRFAGMPPTAYRASLQPARPPQT
ncbi:MAG: helix-turn-helix domain-containing protein [Verrucomicrobiota bacterium]